MQRPDRALEEIAKKLASEITAVLLAPPSPITANNAVLNYANFFWLGIAMHAALTKLGVMPPISELLNEERSLEHSRLEAAIHKQILAKAHETSPDEISPFAEDRESWNQGALFS